jgi:hypothetical protein
MVIVWDSGIGELWFDGYYFLFGKMKKFWR